VGFRNWAKVSAQELLDLRAIFVKGLETDDVVVRVTRLNPTWAEVVVGRGETHCYYDVRMSESDNI
jgi:hypothetical protein